MGSVGSWTDGHLRVELGPRALRLAFGPEGPGRVVAVGTGRRGSGAEHWTACAESPDGAAAAEVDLGEVVVRYAPGVVVDLWIRVDAGESTSVRRLGRFGRTVRPDELSDVVVDGTLVRLRVNPQGNLVLRPGDDVKPLAFGIAGGSVALDDGRLTFEGLLTAFDRQLASAELQVRARQSETTASVVLTTVVDRDRSERSYGAVVHRTTGTLELRGLLHRLEPGDAVLDARLVLTDTTGWVQSVRVHEDAVPDRALGASSVSGEGQVFHLVPHWTFLGGNLSLYVDRFSPRAHAMLERVMRRPWWTAAARRTLGVWLVGEVPYKAQDNGYHLFRWVRTRRPLRLAYYVIDPASPDLGRVARLGRVVEHGSVKHVLLAACAARLVGTHHSEYLLPTADPRMLAAAPGDRVMLQHGVLGTKNMSTTYGSDGRVRPADVFHVSSPRERDIVVDDLGYRPDAVRVTGLPRFDALLAPATEPPDGLLVIPTWRGWVGSAAQFEASAFRARWLAFLGHARFRELVDGGRKVSFILHPNMRRFADEFETPGVDLYRQGDRAVQDLLREHAALVTDYSSVGFDFALLERPVFYFQFDRPRYFRSGPSHLDLDAELPGPVFGEEDALAAAVARSSAAGFPTEQEYRERASRMFPAQDRRSSWRAYRSVRRGAPRGRRPSTSGA